MAGLSDSGGAPTGGGRKGLEASPRRVAWTLALIITGLVCAHGVGLFLDHGLGHNNVRGLVQLFHLDRERNLPSFFSSLLFVFGSAGFYTLHRLDASPRPAGRHWLFLAAIFVFLAADEWFSIHERLIVPVRELLGTSGVFYFAWVIPYGIAVLLLSGYLWPKFLAFPREIRFLFLGSAGVYLLGAVGVELVGGAYFERFGSGSLSFDLIATVEETLEMSGLATLVYAQLRLIVDSMSAARA